MDEHEAAAARASQRALGDPGRERGCDAGVDGVPAGVEDACAGLGGHGVAGGDRSTHGFKRNGASPRRFRPFQLQ